VIEDCQKKATDVLYGLRMQMEMDIQMVRQKSPVSNPRDMYHKLQLGIVTIMIRSLNPSTVWFRDKDSDGYTNGVTQVSCTKPSDEYVLSATSGDCDDNDQNINPAKEEICDGRDNNCDGHIDENNVCLFFGTKLSAGYGHTCIIKQNGSLWCWGNNKYGQLGDGTYEDKNLPVQIISSDVMIVLWGRLIPV
jgi:hypothetical protein